jgi:predicted dehydrogenase
MGKGIPTKFALFGAGTRGELDLGYFFEKNREEIQYSAVAEPDPIRQKHFAERFKIPEKNIFNDWRDLLEKPKLADAIINALPCHMHHESTIAALKAGYDVLLEKPIAHTPGECVHLYNSSKKYNQKLAVCFENRYNKIYQEIKRLLDSGVIGSLMNITCDESIGYWHYILSYVRGIHSRAEEGNSFMIAKGIHDTDLLTWFIQSKASKVSSFGDLSFFNENNAPSGAPERCTDGCPVQNDCVFDALKQYYKPGHMSIPLKLMLSQSFKDMKDVIRNKRFRTLASTITRDLSKPNILKVLKEGPHGKCVFHSENGVVDHQSTSIEYENGVTCSFSLSAFSLIWERTCDLRGTMGEIMSKDYSGRLELRTFNPSKVKKQRIRFRGLHHGGGDEYLLLDFAKAVKSDNPEDKSLTSIENCIESHLIALAAEEARLTGKVVDMTIFRRKADDEASVLASRK